MCKHMICEEADFGVCLLEQLKCGSQGCTRKVVGTCRVILQGIPWVKWCCEKHNTHEEFTPIKDTGYDYWHQKFLDKEITLQMG